jgi:SAM-dependent methyltransferase
MAAASCRFVTTKPSQCAASAQRGYVASSVMSYTAIGVEPRHSSGVWMNSHRRRRDGGRSIGCGVGRISRALADYVPEVIGVDASASMIRLARVLNADVPRCRFFTIREKHLRRFRARSFDLVYSRLVLQHIPPSVVRRCIAEMLRTVAPGGIVMSQLSEQIDVDPIWAFAKRR